LILEGDVQALSISLAGTLTVKLTDGRSFITDDQPPVDEITKVIDQCGEPCLGLVVNEPFKPK
jgi:hypothetical protein